MEKEWDWLFDTESYPFLQARYPLGLTIMYVLSVVLFSPAEEKQEPVETKKDKKKEETKGETKGLDTFTRVVFFHNVLLCLFSLFCFINTFPVALDVMTRKPLSSSFCGHGWMLAFDGPFGKWGWLFYLSKYYEFVDTWIIMAKGRRPIFLQVHFFFFFFFEEREIF
ncbi:long chain acyl-coa elongase [Reticulomyxa filosa]|uniref:Elongation of fatty acids protein n=1 Tax=Reticulomyxa filosa TaxID=46433 RepID=X6M5V7_RETFI|nr:long chain acyl-coa elongase [Reticulomyxa filosa]|eukprot:ETO09309.1 long chain acyl-coa elongase [Reticulomyxa filosa]